MLSCPVMGEHGHQTAGRSEELRTLSRALREDARALECTIAEGRIEAGARRIGAEQEVSLVDESWRPALPAREIPERLADDPFTPELTRFNLEANLLPQVCSGGLMDWERVRHVPVEDHGGRLVGLLCQRARKVGCPPVVEGDRLVRLVTETSFIHVAGKLLVESLREPEA